MRIAMKGTIALTLALGLTLSGGLAANAWQGQGSKQCTGTRTPELTLNTSGGSGTWTNYNSPGFQTPFTFASGVKVKYSPYQSTYYYAAADYSYASPFITCV